MSWSCPQCGCDADDPQTPDYCIGVASFNDQAGALVIHRSGAFEHIEGGGIRHIESGVEFRSASFVGNVSDFV